jgi:hypothetical protein
MDARADFIGLWCSLSGTNLPPTSLKTAGKNPRAPPSGEAAFCTGRDLSMADFDDLVRTEAYLIWESEGRPQGQHDQHWLMAVERVKSRLSEKNHAPVIPLPLKRVMLSARFKRAAHQGAPMRASA